MFRESAASWRKRLPNIEGSKIMADDDDNGLSTVFSDILMQIGACNSNDEAILIVDVILDEMKEQNLCIGSSGSQEFLEHCLNEYLDLSNQQEVKDLVSRLFAWNMVRQGKNEIGMTLEEQNDDYGSHSIVYENEEEDEVGGSIPLFDGECELCDRYIQLTKHHLIPKSTWPRIETRLRHAVEEIERGEVDKAVILLGPGLIHLMNDLQQGADDKQSIRRILHRTCDICRPCHSALHKAHNNMDLALSYCTVNLILQDGQMAKFCKWASKQKPGKYAVRNKVHLWRE